MPKFIKGTSQDAFNDVKNSMNFLFPNWMVSMPDTNLRKNL